jgi:hypothetical protein
MRPSRKPMMRAVFGDVHFVRHQHDGQAALFVEALKDPHHLD